MNNSMQSTDTNVAGATTLSKDALPGGVNPIRQATSVSGPNELGSQGWLLVQLQEELGHAREELRRMQELNNVLVQRLFASRDQNSENSEVGAILLGGLKSASGEGVPQDLQRQEREGAKRHESGAEALRSKATENFPEDENLGGTDLSMAVATPIVVRRPPAVGPEGSKVEAPRTPAAVKTPAVESKSQVIMIGDVELRIKFGGTKLDCKKMEFKTYQNDRLKFEGKGSRGDAHVLSDLFKVLMAWIAHVETWDLDEQSAWVVLRANMHGEAEEVVWECRSLRAGVE